jgi:hypothetical protein
MNRHCDGCDQDDETTIPRRVHVRGYGPGATDGNREWNYCDDCARTIAAGEHDTFDSISPEPPLIEYVDDSWMQAQRLFTPRGRT